MNYNPQVMLLQVTAYRRARRALAQDQGRPLPCRLPLWRLVIGEIAVLARRVGRWRFSALIAIGFVSILLAQIAFSPSTPGPVLTNPWRWVAAALLAAVGLAGWAVVHAVRRTKAAA
ncbi:MAG: hypothetical protein OES24_18500 [Acidimicrobiia bacterium]|nr:hypothetical protein [Acidimicrobiia bacterium]